VERVIVITHGRKNVGIGKESNGLMRGTGGRNHPWGMNVEDGKEPSLLGLTVV
jgi:hypothetical protein